MEDSNMVSTGYVIMNPFLGKPMKETPSGMPLENITFSTKIELQEFVEKHWNNPVFMVDGKDLESPE